MTTTTPTELWTVRAVLTGSAERSLTDELVDSLRQHGSLGSLNLATQAQARSIDDAVHHEIANVVDEFLGLDLIDLAAGGWARYAKLREAAHYTRDNPPAEAVVPLARHRIRSVHHPYVDLLVDDELVRTVKFDLIVDFDVQAVVAVVKNARLVAVRAGYCTVKAALGMDGNELVSRETRLDLPAALQARDGIPLLRALPTDQQTASS